MCGFGGVINHLKGVGITDLAIAARCVSFRGPDSSKARVLNEDMQGADVGPHGVFFNRLAIVDLDKRSDQPFEDETHLLIFNGEIYNYQELKIELQKQGIQFKTTSDTEVLFYALKVWDIEILTRLNGMFAFFWLDKKEKRYIISRDRSGIKPVYYYKKGAEFVFASELYTIIRLASQPLSISKDAAEMYLRMQFIPTPYTIIEEVHKLPPGHYLDGYVTNDRKPNPVCYWDAYLAADSTPPSGSSSLETVLKNSLGRQLHADVPLGLFLSSGVDSSLLAALVNKYYSSGKKVNFFSVQFDENTISDESKDAKEFIDGFGNSNLNCKTISINPSLVKDHIYDLYSFFDEPFADHASLLNWLISEKAKEQVTVAISGDGADELFWGYNRYIRWKKFSKLNNIIVLPDIARTVAAIFPPSNLKNNLRFVLEKDPVRRHFNFFLSSGMRNRINDNITKYPLWALENIDKISKRDDFTGLLDIKTYLADAMLYKVDRASMAASLEVRVPYLDNEVIDFAFYMPLSQKSNTRFKNKAPLKELLVNLAPHYPVNRPKRGFSFPLNKWMKENWKDLITSVITEKNLASAGLDPTPLMALVRDFYNSKNEYFTDVWCIFNLCLWLDNLKNIRNTVKQ